MFSCKQSLFYFKYSKVEWATMNDHESEETIGDYNVKLTVSSE